MTRVYVVEDEAIVALGQCDLVRELGYQVCGYALRATDALEQIPKLRPDLVLMDINLGPGVGGVELAEILQERMDVAVVFVTAYADSTLSQRAAQTEAFAYVVKPFHPYELRANMELALVRHRAERRLRDAVAEVQQVSEALRLQTLELERSNGLLVSVFDACEDGLMVVDLTGKVEALTPSFVALWNLPAELVALGSASEILEWCAVRSDAPHRLRALADPFAPNGDSRPRVCASDGRTVEPIAMPRTVGGAVVGRVVRFRVVNDAADPPIEEP